MVQSWASACSVCHRDVRWPPLYRCRRLPSPLPPPPALAITAVHSALLDGRRCGFFVARERPADIVSAVGNGGRHLLTTITALSAALLCRCRAALAAGPNEKKIISARQRPQRLGSGAAVRAEGASTRRRRPRQKCRTSSSRSADARDDSGEGEGGGRGGDGVRRQIVAGLASLS